jgi:hypothetical protein
MSSLCSVVVRSCEAATVPWKVPYFPPDTTGRIKESVKDALAQLREVGSTLLLKGLEADISVVLNAGALNARNLYVAMTRGSRRVLVCSPSPILNPTW